MSSQKKLYGLALWNIYTLTRVWFWSVCPALGNRHQNNTRVSVYTVCYDSICITWWRHQMDTFSALLLALCASAQRSFDVFFDLSLNKSSRRLWFETPSHRLWRHCNDFIFHGIMTQYITMKWRSSHTDSVSHLPCLCFADDVTIKCWWLYKCMTWRDSCDASTWQAISNPLNIDFNFVKKREYISLQ